MAEPDSNAWVSEAKRIRGKKQPPTTSLSAWRFLLSAFLVSAFHPPSRALAAETLTLERTLSDLVKQAYAPNPAEIALMWQTAPPRRPIRPSF